MKPPGQCVSRLFVYCVYFVVVVVYDHYFAIGVGNRFWCA